MGHRAFRRHDDWVSRKGVHSTRFNESIDPKETFDDWKVWVYQYLDKRVDVDKVKVLGKYIRDFLKHEWDNGEPSWFAAAESVVNYVRANYPEALKDRSHATSFWESAR